MAEAAEPRTRWTILGRRPVVERPGRAPAASIGRYVRENWWRRRRTLLFIALVGFAFFYGLAFVVVGQFLPVEFAAPLVILGGILIWTLPETGRPPTRLLDRLMIALLVVLGAWPDYLALSLPGLPWITAIRLVSGPMLLVLLVCVSVSREFRTTIAHRLAATPWVGRFVITFAVLTPVSILYSTSVSNSLDKFVIVESTWIAVFFTSCWTFAQPGRARTLAALMCGLLLFVCVAGLYEYRYSQLPWAGRVPSFLAVEDEAVQRVLQGSARASTGVYRVQSIFTTSLGLGEFIGLTFPFLLHVLMTTRRLWVRLVATAGVPLVGLVVVATDSRLAVIGFGMSFLLYVFFWALMRWRSDKESLLAPVVMLAYPAIFTVFTAATFVIGRLRTMVWGGGAAQASTDTRLQMYETGIPMVLKAPWGHGIGQGGPTLGFYNRAGIGTIDTYYLSVALELGVVGFVVFFGAFAVAIWSAGKALLQTRDRETMLLAPLAIALANFLLSKSVFSQLGNHPIAFAMLGVVVALVARTRNAEPATPVASRATSLRHALA